MKLKIRELRNAQKLTLRELGQKLNISFSQLAKIERGESYASSEQIVLFAEFFGVTTDYLLGLTSIKNQNDELCEKFHPVKVLSYNELVEPRDLLAKNYLTANITDPNNYFYLMIEDDSMESMFSIGDFLLVKFDTTPKNNDIIVVAINDNEILTRKYVELDHSSLLIPNNFEYDAISLNPKMNYHVIGVVVACYREL